MKEMKETIIFASGVNSRELTVGLARHGINCFNMRVCNGIGLARLALMRSGINIDQEILDFKDETAIVAELIEGSDYFRRTSLSDIQAITSTISTMRQLIYASEDETDKIDELVWGPFAKKNAALSGVFKQYLARLDAGHLVDNASLIRRAALESKVLDADIIILDDFPPSPLEESMLRTVSGKGAKHKRLHELFDVASGGAIQIASYKNCYGAPNEVETILTDIYKGKKLDQCTVAVTDPATYSQLFLDYSLQHNIPITFGCGIPIINSNPARLLSLYLHWKTRGFFGASAIAEMLSSDAFDRKKLYEIFDNEELERGDDFHWNAFLAELGSLKLSDDSSINKTRIKQYEKAVAEDEERDDEYDYTPFLKVMADELALPIEEFIRTFARLRKSGKTFGEKLLVKIDRSAGFMIYEELKAARNGGLKESLDDIIMNVLKKSACRQSSEGGRLHVTGVNNAIFSIRGTLYVAGMSASKYPGAPRENYLLLDDDLTHCFGERAKYLTSEGIVRNKLEQMKSLIRLASALDAEIHISYAGMDVSELKKDNASSLIYEIFKEERGTEATSEELKKTVKKVGYFDPSISKTKHIGLAYNRGDQIIGSSDDDTKPEAFGWGIDREYSPSALDTYFNCPRQFMLKYLVGVPETEEDDPLKIITPIETGKLTHALMKIQGDSPMTREAFLKLSEEHFDRFIAERPPIITENIEVEKEDFLELMTAAYDGDSHRTVLLGEKDIHCEHAESNVKIHGYPDRVEKLDNEDDDDDTDKYLIVDFKTGSSLKHEKDDINTCLQVLIYAYLMESKGYNIAGCEYRYPRLDNEIVSCKYDDEIKKQLTQRLKQFKKSLESGVFPIAKPKDDDDDTCRFCTYGNLCGKNEEETEEEGAND